MATSPAAIKLQNNVIHVDEYEDILGDQIEIGNYLIGGDDIIIGANWASGGYSALGDSEVINGNGKGGNDRFTGGNNAGTPSSIGYIPFFPVSTGFEPFEQVGLESSSGGSGPVVFAGDAAYMAELSVGGNDTITGGTNSGNIFVGDALELAIDGSRGGNDSIKGGNALGDWGSSGSASNEMVGDSGTMFDSAAGGLDTLIGGNATGAHGGGAFVYNLMIGDGGEMGGNSAGAADRLTGGNVAASTDGYALAFNVMAGDADVMGDDARGGADTLTAGNLSVAWAGSGDYADGYAINMMAGDSFVMYDDAVAGNDTLTGGLATFTGSDGYSGDGYGVALNIFAGDTFDLEGAATLGNDKLTGTSVAAGSDGYAINIMAGDSMDSLPFLLSGSIDDFTPSSFTETLGALDIGSGDYDYDGIQYGNDTITGGNGQAMNMMVGDGYSMGSYDTGGNDRIQAGSGLAENMLIGDAWYAYGAQGGNDTLISSTSDDVMFGDFASGDGTGGMDRFIFAPSNGEDTIVDFEVGVDKIDLIALKANPQLRSYAVMLSSNRLIDTGDDIVLHLGTSAASSDNIVTLVGVDNASDLMNSFIFV